MPNRQHTILLIEDNRDDIELILMALQDFTTDYPIQVVRNGALALDYLFCEGQYAERNAQYMPKLILLDLKLPKIDGIQVLRNIKRDSRTQTIPVVVLTSSQEARDVKTCFEIGANSYVVKPMDVENFSTILQEIGKYWMHINENDI